MGRVRGFYSLVLQVSLRFLNLDGSGFVPALPPTDQLSLVDLWYVQPVPDDRGIAHRVIVADKHISPLWSLHSVCVSLFQVAPLASIDQFVAACPWIANLCADEIAKHYSFLFSRVHSNCAFLQASTNMTVIANDTLKGRLQVYTGSIVTQTLWRQITYNERSKLVFILRGSRRALLSTRRRYAYG